MALDFAKEREEDLLLTLGDLAFVKKSDYEKLMEAYSGKTLYSSFNSHYGPPCIIPLQVLKDLPQVGGKKGLKGLIPEFEKVPLSNASKDIDFVDDIDRFKTQ